MTLRPFFTYFGGKWRAAPKYPPPSSKNVHTRRRWIKAGCRESY